MDHYKKHYDDRDQDLFKGPIYYLGVALVVTGAIAILYLLMSVMTVMKSPEESELVQWALSTISEGDVMLSGHIDGKEFSFQASEPFQYLILCAIGLIIINLLVLISNSLIGGGVKLIRTVNRK